MKFTQLKQVLSTKIKGVPLWVILLVGFSITAQFPSTPKNDQVINNPVPEVTASPIPSPVIEPEPLPIPSPDPNKPNLKQADVFHECRMLAASGAISPSTVKHGADKMPEYNPESKQWFFAAWIDAQNAYGATMRNTYTCTVDDTTGKITLNYN